MSSLFSSTLNTRPLIENSLRYIRSDVPDKLTPDEVQWLIEHDVTTLVDLRTRDEIENRPIRWRNESFKYINIPVSGGNAVPNCVEGVHKSYLKMVDVQMMKIIKYIENSGSNVMYFCNAGKDRTGVVSALLLLHLGMSKEEIIRDYVLSAENLKGMLTDFCRANPDTDIDIITPKAEYMSLFLDNVKSVDVLHEK